MKLFFILFFLAVSSLGFSQDEDEMLDKLIEEKAKQNASYQQIDKGAQAIQDAPFNMFEELKKTGHDKIDVSTLMDGKAVEVLRKSIRESNIQNLSPEDLRAMILGNVKGKPAEKLFKRFPKLLDIAVAVMRDRDALPAMLGIMTRREDFKMVVYVSIGLMIFGFISKKMLLKKDAHFLKRFAFSVGISLLATLASFVFLFYRFQEELGPTLKIIVKIL